jgi:hypothetical protein
MKNNQLENPETDFREFIEKKKIKLWEELIKKKLYRL